MPVIATNTASNTALRYLNLNASTESSTLSKLASGSRIVKASDDAAGLANGKSIESDKTVLTQTQSSSFANEAAFVDKDTVEKFFSSQKSSIDSEMANAFAQATSSAVSNTTDADMAAEKSKLSSAELLPQALVAPLTQANSMPKELLNLLT